jgi:Nickel responsive protein SCO4226-like
MALYAIRRDVGPMTSDDVDAAGFRATTCAAEYDGLRWVRSYWDRERGQLLCYYEARNADQIRDHSRKAAIPCDDVFEVTEVLPDVYAAAAGVRS